MSSLIEGARKLVARGSDIDARVAGLDAAVTAGQGRLDDRVLDHAGQVVRRASERLRLSAEHTIVALAGATGSGKSSTFNALTGLDLASVGVRRPTTSWTTACTWGNTGAPEVLEWLGVPPRHQIMRDSMLDRRKPASDLDGLILLDLPDHDSTEVAHHLEADRLVQLADMLVWVLDPQKYADALIHDKYFRPMAAHRDVMMVVVNHIDEIRADRRDQVMSDVKRLLVADGLGGVPVLATSAATGEGIDQLKEMITQRVADKKATRQRLAVDVANAADRVLAESGEAPAPKLGERDQRELRDAVADAAGVPIVVEAVRNATLQRTRRATGWPLTSWVSRLRPDPLKRLHLDLDRGGRDLVVQARSSMPRANEVQKARVDMAVRGLSDKLSQGLAQPWSQSFRRASTSRSADLTDALDRAVGGTDLGNTRVPAWAQGVRVLQWLIFLTALAGGVWLGVIAATGYLQMDEVLPTPEFRGFPIPTLLLLGGIALGILLALVSRWLVSITARSRARKVEQRLRAAVDVVADELVVQPLVAEVQAYRTVVDGLRAARA